MAYTPQVWADGEAGGTPVTAARLNHAETGIADAHADIGVIESDLVDIEARLAALESPA